MTHPRSIGIEVKVLTNLIKRSIDEKITSSQLNGITGMQGWIISYLYSNSDREVFQRDLEKKFNIRRSTVSGVLQLMERDGLITREPVEYDGRLKRLELTPKAIETYKTITEKINEIENKLRSGLSQQEINAFFAVIDKIKKNIE